MSSKTIHPMCQTFQYTVLPVMLSANETWAKKKNKNWLHVTPLLRWLIILSGLVVQQVFQLAVKLTEEQE